jgi:hypothetical protein
MTLNMNDFLLPLLILSICLPLASLLGNWVVTYRFSEVGISLIYRTVFGKLEVGYLRFNLIASAKVVQTWKVFPLLFVPVLSFGLRWWQKQAVIVRMKSGGFRWVLLTPKDIDYFLRTIRAKMPQGSFVEDCRLARNRLKEE